MKSIALLLVLFLLVGCAGPGGEGYDPTPMERDDLCTAVFHYLFAHGNAAIKAGSEDYCLAILKADPEAGFLVRFKGHHPPVKAASAFRPGKSLKFRIDAIRWLGPEKAEVEGGYYYGRRCAAGNTYTLEKKSGKWQVTNTRIGWIS